MVEVDRAAGVRPVEERPGGESRYAGDGPAQLAALDRDWLRQAGAAVDDDVVVEISPLYALDAEELAAKIRPGTRITTPTYFGVIQQAADRVVAPADGATTSVLRPLCALTFRPALPSASFRASPPASLRPWPPWSWPACSSFFCLALGSFLGFLLLLEDLVAAEVNLVEHLVGDDVVPVGEAGVQFADPLLAVGDLLLVLLLLPLVVLLDPSRSASWAFLSSGLLLGLLRPSSRRLLLGGFLSSGFFPSAGFFSASFLASGSGSSCGLGMTSGLNSAMTNR